MEIDWESWALGIGSFFTGAGALWLKFRTSNREDRAEDRDTREELLGLLQRMQQSQVAWMDERARLHAENLEMKEKVSGLTRECEKLREAVEDLRMRLEDRDQMERSFWNEHFGAAPIPILRVGANGEVEDCNEAFEEAFGYPRAQVTELKWQEITHPDDLDADLAMVGECLAGTRDRYVMRKRYKRKLGKGWVPLTLHVVAVRRMGEFRYFNSFVVPLGDEK